MRGAPRLFFVTLLALVVLANARPSHAIRFSPSARVRAERRAERTERALATLLVNKYDKRAFRTLRRNNTHVRDVYNLKKEKHGVPQLHAKALIGGGFTLATMALGVLFGDMLLGASPAGPVQQAIVYTIGAAMGWLAMAAPTLGATTQLSKATHAAHLETLDEIFAGRK